MAKAILYLKMSAKALLQQPSLETLKSVVKYFRAWDSHLAPERNPVLDAQPWMAFAAIDFLTKISFPEMKIFEYGSGGSTLFWAAHASTVISIEHDVDWYTQMKNILINKGIHNTIYTLAPAEPDNLFDQKDFKNPDAYISSDKIYNGQKFETYVKMIDNYPDEAFDVVIVDGRARPSCIQHAIPKVRNGGYLVVDNSERTYYLKPFSFEKRLWKNWIFYGPVPYNRHFSETTIYQKKQV